MNPQSPPESPLSSRESTDKREEHGFAQPTIEAEVARMNGAVLPANEFGAIVPSNDVPTVPMVDAAEELPADSRTLLPPVDLSELLPPVELTPRVLRVASSEGRVTYLPHHKRGAR